MLLIHKIIAPYGKAPEYEPQLTVDFVCNNCHCTTRIAAQNVADSQTLMWKDAYLDLLGKLNTAVEICHAKYGTDPMYQHMRDELIKIRNSIPG